MPDKNCQAESSPHVSLVAFSAFHSSVSKKRISASVVNGSVFSAIAVSMRFSSVNVFFLISDYI